jgi:hypothetical protein
LWELEGCEAEGQECQTLGAPLLGEINDVFQWRERAPEPGAPRPGWRGELGLIGTTPVTVGIQYAAENHERLFDRIICRGTIGFVSIGGDGPRKTSLISTLTPVNAMTEEVTETYAESERGVASPAKLEHHQPAVAMALVAGRWEQIAIVARFTYRTELGGDPVEIRAIP